MNEKQLQAISKLVDIGLEYSVDYIYILEDIKKILNGKDVQPEDIETEYYLDF